MEHKRKQATISAKMLPSKRGDKMEMTARDRLIQAFWKLYRLKPVEQIRVHELTEKAQCNRSTFYRQFSDVYDVLEQEEQKLLANLQVSMSELAATKHQVVFSKLLTVYHDWAEPLCILIERGNQRFSQNLKQLIKVQLRQQLGELSAQQELVVEFQLSGLLGAFVCWYRQYPDVSELEWLELIKAINFQGGAQLLQNNEKSSLPELSGVS